MSAGVELADRASWWQWPTILSLDAPVVTMVWQQLLAHVAGVRLGWPYAFVLGASVWLAYAADRWTEGWRLPAGQVRTQRHRFSQRRRSAIASVWAGVFAADLAVAVACLSRRELAAGLLLLAFVLPYLLSHQLAHRDRRWRVPKELCVAALLTGGVAVFIVIRAGALPITLPLATFGVLCFCNCALISTWEHEVDAVQGQTSIARQFRRGAALSHALPWTMVAASLALLLLGNGPSADVAGYATGSSLLLAGIDAVEPRTGWPLARLLADAALLTPLLALLHAR